ncbi:Aminotransferase-like, plant mobile domain [Sesbania bispinosa]|nr:Aminotransferase-like, plant mobile domain [Sesbania bispinosa]
MARTRGGHSDQGRESSSQHVDRVRPTASARQRKFKQQVQETQEDPTPDQAQQEDPALDQVHQEDLAPVQADVQADVVSPVQADVYGDRGPLSSFVERWHRDMCSFRLPVGEMTITLDDMSNLLLLPVTGRLFSLPTMGKKEANMMLINLFRISHQYAWAETEVTRGAYVSPRWLRDLYDVNVQQGKYITEINSLLLRYDHLLIIL